MLEKKKKSQKHILKLTYSVLRCGTRVQRSVGRLGRLALSR
jgi:hypothetical protein